MTKKICPYLCTLLSMMTLALGCGKKVEENKDRPYFPPNPQKPDIEIELDKQELFCGSERSCPDYLTKIAFNDKGKLKFCTGFLMEQDMVVTSSSCLPENLRMRDASCVKNAFFFFAEQGEKPTRVGCDKVLEVSQLEGKEPFLWHSDVVYLKLNKKISRRVVSYPKTRTGMNDMDKFYTWTVDQIDDHQGIMRKSEDCQAVHGTYFNPLSTALASPVMVMAGCEFKDGNSGSPVLDYRGRVRGVVSAPVDEAEIAEVISMRILERPLKKLMHVSNSACLPVVPHQEVLNENECNKRLDITSHDLAQRDMINEALLFKATLQRIETTESDKNDYLKLGVVLTPGDDAYHVQFKVKCFKDVDTWIRGFTNNKPFTFNIELPSIKIKKTMNEYGRIFANDVVDPTKKEPTNFQFKPSILRNTNPRQATVFMWSNGPTTTFPAVSETCESLF